MTRRWWGWVDADERNAGVPEGLAVLAPGPELGAVLVGLYPCRAQWSHGQAVQVTVAGERQANHSRAVSPGFTLDTALRRMDPGDDRAYRELPDRSGDALVGLLLSRSHGSAHFEVRLSYDTLVRLPMLHAAMPAGS